MQSSTNNDQKKNDIISLEHLHQTMQNINIYIYIYIYI